MAGSQVDRKLEAWREVASEAALPSNPPKVSAASSVGFATLAAVTGLLVILIVVRPNLFGTAGGTTVASGPAVASAGSAVAVLPSGTAPSDAATPSLASATSTPSALPSGVCSADQIVVGSVATGPGGSTFATESVYVHVALRNTGSDCTLRIPPTVRVTSSSGASQQVDVENAMTTATFGAKAGQAFTVIMGAWWPYHGSAQITGCKLPITVVRSVSIALAGGSLDIALDQPWAQACSSPATVSLEYRK